MGIFDWFAGVPSEATFARQIMQALADAGDTRHAEFRPEEFQIVFTEEGRNAGVANLRNVYREFCSRNQQERPSMLRSCVRALMVHVKPMPDEFEDAAHDLLPVVRNRSYYELLHLQQRIDGGPPQPWPYLEISDDLGASLVFDLPEATRSIMQHDLDAWGVTFYEAYERALANLAGHEAAFARLGEGLYASATGDSYDSARLLLKDLVRRFEVQGRHVAMVPNRETLLVTGSDDPAGLALMAKIADEAYQQQPRSIAATALQLDEDEWRPWLPPADHPQFTDFKRMALRSWANDYQEQKQLLDRLYEKEQTAEFVASFSAVQGENGPPFSYCVWSDVQPALLPRVEVVFLMKTGSGGEPTLLGQADWERIDQIAGHYLTEVEGFPPRFRVESFPTPAEVAALLK